MTISVLAKKDFEPRSWREAEEFFARKTPLTSEQFEALSKVNRARAFRIAGLHKASVVQAARDIVKRGIRDSTPFPEIRRKLLELFDVAGLPRPAQHRLLLTYRQNAFHAYSVARKQQLDEPETVGFFPYREYRALSGTPGDRGVRPMHAALHAKIFAGDDPFWDHFTPPWEWNCRCSFLGVTKRQAQGQTIWTYRGGAIVPLTKAGAVSKRAKRMKIRPHPDFDFARDTFDPEKFDLSGLDEEIRRAVE